MKGGNSNGRDINCTGSLVAGADQSPGDVALPIALTNAMMFLGCTLWGWIADQTGRRWAMIIPAAIGILITPFYLGFFTKSYEILVLAFTVQGFFAGAVYGQNPSYLNERFPTEVRATAAGFCYHQGALWGGAIGTVLAAWAATEPLGFAMPMLIVTIVAEIVFIIALLLGPETKGTELVSDITLRRDSNSFAGPGDVPGSR